MRRKRKAADPQADDGRAASQKSEARERGERLDSTGAGVAFVWLVAGGLFELLPANAASPAARPFYAARGDFIGLSEALRARAIGASATLMLPHRGRPLRIGTSRG